MLTTRTTAAQNYRRTKKIKTLPVKAPEKSLGELDLHPRPRTEQLVRPRLADRYFQVTHAPDVYERLVRPSLRIGRGRRGDVVGVNPHASRGRLQVGDQISKTVYPQHPRPDVGQQDRWISRPAQRLERNARCERSRGRRKHISTFKGGRPMRPGRELVRPLQSHLVDHD